VHIRILGQYAKALNVNVEVTKTIWIFAKINLCTIYYLYYMWEFNMAECKCGRSPSGNCVGWHNLTKEQYLGKKAAYEEKQCAK
jgi:hypothetical protein